MTHDDSSSCRYAMLCSIIYKEKGRGENAAEYGDLSTKVMIEQSINELN